MDEMFHYDTCGLPNIYLDGGVTVHDTPHGPATSIADLDGLHHLIAMDIINDPAPMSPEEFRFLRIELDLSQRALAAILQTEEKNVQRWETGNTKLPGPATVALVGYYLSRRNYPDIAALMDHLAELDRKIVEMRTFRLEDDHWESAA